MNNNIIYISETKYQELTAKLENLQKIKFRENRESMQTAIETGGGMHDNASYEIAAQEEKLLAKQIEELDQLLLRVKIIDTTKIDTTSVHIGTRVKVRNLDNSLIAYYVIVGAYETDLSCNHISYLAPLASGLMGKKVGDIVDIKTPNKLLRFNILNIEKSVI